MSIKTKTTAAAALAALSLPGAALADRSDRASEAHQKSAAHKTHSSKARAFVVKGDEVANLTVTGGALAGALTLDPTAANKHARRALELTKAELRGTTTVTFGEAGDAVRIKYIGLQSTDALQPTDVVKIIGKISRSGELNIRRIIVKRPSA